MQERKPLRIEIPRGETVRLGRVGVIAVIGFAIGIVWPHLAGMRLVPTVPSEKAEANNPELSGAPVEPQSSAAAATGAATAGPGEPADPAALAQPAKEPFTVATGEVTGCRGPSGKRLKDCDPIEFDAVARGRIMTLSACDRAQRAVGILSLGFELDFKKDRVVDVTSGKSTSLPQEDVDALLACLKQNLGEVSLAGIRHEHERYSIFYKVEFSGSAEKKKTTSAAGTAAAAAAADSMPASGKATVAWDVALVRSAPSRDGDVVARVLQGTRVAVSARSGDWYKIKYDAKGGEGWVFRTAIGM